MNKLGEKWCMCIRLSTVARDMNSTCSICGGIDAYGISPERTGKYKKIVIYPNKTEEKPDRIVPPSKELQPNYSLRKQFEEETKTKAILTSDSFSPPSWDYVFWLERIILDRKCPQS